MVNTNGFEVSVSLSLSLKCVFVLSDVNSWIVPRRSLYVEEAFMSMVTSRIRESLLFFPLGLFLSTYNKSRPLPSSRETAQQSMQKTARCTKNTLIKGLKCPNKDSKNLHPDPVLVTRTWVLVSRKYQDLGNKKDGGSGQSNIGFIHDWLMASSLALVAAGRPPWEEAARECPQEAKEIAERRKVEKKSAARKRNSDSFISLNTWEAPTNLGVWVAAKKTKSKRHVDMGCRGLAGGREVISGSLR